MFYMDVREIDNYAFYYNMVAEVNKNVTKVVGELTDRPISQGAMNYRNNRLAGGLSKSYGPSEFGMMGVKNLNTGKMEYASALDMAGISAKVSKDIAQEILERAIFYCPKDSGYLASTGRIEQMPDGSCRIFFDCPYAYYVHEYTWRKHDFPTCAKFLTLAIQEVETLHGYGWAK